MENNVKYKFLEEELYKIRKSKGFSQEELAEKINVSRQSIHLWEAGKIVPDMENIVNICNVLDVAPNQLISGLDNTSSTTKKINKRKIIKNLILFIALLLVIYLIISLRKSFILLKLNNKIQNFSNLTNYTYTETYYETKDLQVQNNYTTKVYYKNGIYKEDFTDVIGTNYTIYRDRNKNQAYYFDNIKMTYCERNPEEFIPKENELVYSIMAPSRVTKNNNFINFIYGVNPHFNIINKKDIYVSNFTTQINNVKIKICEKIDKNTGLVNSIYTYYPDGKYTVKEYDLKINITEDNDILIPNFSLYKNS